MIVPLWLVRAQAEEEGLADIFKEAGFEWRWRHVFGHEPDQLTPGERCATTSTATLKAVKVVVDVRTSCHQQWQPRGVTGRLTDVRR